MPGQRKLIVVPIVGLCVCSITVLAILLKGRSLWFLSSEGGRDLGLAPLVERVLILFVGGGIGTAISIVGLTMAVRADNRASRSLMGTSVLLCLIGPALIVFAFCFVLG